jgi:hypothetical protein
VLERKLLGSRNRAETNSFGSTSLAITSQNYDFFWKQLQSSLLMYCTQKTYLESLAQVYGFRRKNQNVSDKSRLTDKKTHFSIFILYTGTKIFHYSYTLLKILYFCGNKSKKTFKCQKPITVCVSNFDLAGSFRPTK